MPKIHGLHHLAVSTADMKAQITFCTEVLGMKLVALYWMHGVNEAWHGFLSLNDNSALAFVSMPGNADGKAELGNSHAAHSGGPSAGGTMQHIALNVDSYEDLIAMRNRIRSHGVPVFGPVNHGFCHSLYFAGPEGLNLELSWTAYPIDPALWIDPEVVALAGISADELEGFLSPEPTVAGGEVVAQPAYDPSKPHLHYPQKIYDRLLTLSDAEFAARSDYSDPPVQPQHA